jgi:hypothetical protein
MNGFRITYYFKENNEVQIICDDSIPLKASYELFQNNNTIQIPSLGFLIGSIGSFRKVYH